MLAVGRGLAGVTHEVGEDGPGLSPGEPRELRAAGGRESGDETADDLFRQQLLVLGQRVDALGQSCDLVRAVRAADHRREGRQQLAAVRRRAETFVCQNQAKHFAGPAVHRAQNCQPDPGIPAVAPGQCHQGATRHRPFDRTERKRQLVSNAQVGVIAHLFQSVTNLRGGLEPLGQPQGMLADVGVGVVQSAEDRGDVRRLRAVEGV